jgi:glycosyltransferase involved in cell wall biosynthesis
MATEVPIVATSVGGVPHIVSTEEALMVPPEDPGALAAAIRAVQTDPEAARERARQALRRLRLEHNVSPWLARYDEVYRHVLTASRVAAS